MSVRKSFLWYSAFTKEDNVCNRWILITVRRRKGKDSEVKRLSSGTRSIKTGTYEIQVIEMYFVFLQSALP
jgi:hypothetical protein